MSDLREAPLGAKQFLKGDNLEIGPFPSVLADRSLSWDVNQAEAALLESMRMAAPSAVQSFEHQAVDNLFDILENHDDTLRDNLLSFPDGLRRRSASSSDHISWQEKAVREQENSGPASRKDLTDVVHRPTYLAQLSKSPMIPSDSNVSVLANPESISIPYSRKMHHQHSIEFEIHEDSPGITPEIQRQVGHLPLSPGLDIPKETLGSQERLEISDEIGVSQTPRSQRMRSFNVTPIHNRHFHSVFEGDW